MTEVCHDFMMADTKNVHTMYNYIILFMHKSDAQIES